MNTLLPLLIVLLRSARALPADVAWWLGRWLGACYSQWPGRESRRASEHLARAFPGASEAWRRRVQRATFAHAGGMALWTLRSLGCDGRALTRRIQVSGGEHLRETLRAVQRGQGTVVFTGHFGNWELLGRAIGAIAPSAVVGRRMRSPLADALIKWMRTGTGCIQIDQQEGLRPVLRALRAGRIIGCLADQDVPALSGGFVPWFGQPAYTPTGPAMLAGMQPDTAMQVVVCYRHGRHWRIHAEPRWSFPSGDRGHAALALTARATATVEAIVRRHPQQWVWWHKRWRTRPHDRPHAPLWPPSPREEAP